MVQTHSFKSNLHVCEAYFLHSVHRSSACQEQPSQNSSYVLEANEAVTVKETETVDKQQEEGNSDSYKKQLMDELDKKVEEKSKFNLLFEIIVIVCNHAVL